MTSVFLSYTREDVDRARPLAAALEKAGHAVWWDQHIRSGAEFGNEIEEALAKADAVVVLWSEHSVRSAWVRDEAAAGRDRGRLVPVSIGKAVPPLGFRQYQTTDLSRWKGRTNSPEFMEVLGAVASFGRGSPTREPAPSPKRALPRPHAAILIGVLAAVVLIAGLLVWRPWSEASSTPIVAVAAASPSKEANALSREMLAKLGNLHSTQTDKLRLVQGGEDQARADFIFEVDGSTREQAATANLVLLAGKDRVLLWSKDFGQPLAERGDLMQQLAFTAARVLGCVLEALSPGDAPLSQEVLKPYLSACALLGDISSQDSSQLITALQNVIRQAPRFKPAWAKMLVAQTTRYQSASAEERSEIAADFRRHIAAARRIDPNMPEAFLAELELVPAPFFFEQIKLADQALSAGPENPRVLSGRALAMLVVGRLDAAVDDARRAKSLDPLSPAVRNQYIEALTFAGRNDSARSELVEAEELWPGATTILNERFRFNSSIGDAKDALRLIRSGAIEGSRGLDAFLEARIQPTKPNVDRAIRLAMSNRADSAVWLRQIILVLGEFDRTDELLAILLERHNPREIPYFVDTMFRPAQADLRADPRFMLVTARFGLLEYWRRSGDWPDFCADPDLPYDCKAEAAKLAQGPG